MVLNVKLVWKQRDTETVQQGINLLLMTQILITGGITKILHFFLSREKTKDLRDKILTSNEAILCFSNEICAKGLKDEGGNKLGVWD